ncbi:bacterial Ig-like domain-containing protein, partial [Enterococcus faecalis]
MNKILLFLLMSFVCIIQGDIAFAEDPTNKSDTSYIKFQDPYYVYEGDSFLAAYPYIDGQNSNGKRIPFADIKWEWGSKPISALSKAGDVGYIKYSYDNIMTGDNLTQKVEIKVVSNQIDRSQIQLKDATFYIGEKVDLSRVFLSAKNKYGNDLTWTEAKEKTLFQINGIIPGTIDTSRPGEYIVQAFMENKLGSYTIRSNIVHVIVKESRASLRTRDTEIPIGKIWDPKDNFVSATDDAGNSLPWIPNNYNISPIDIDTSKPGVYEIKITLKKGTKDVSSKFKVTVKDDYTSIKTKDSTLYTGQKWKPEDNFVSATDEIGRDVPGLDSRITISPRDIDTSKPGVHEIIYTFKGVMQDIVSKCNVIV